MTNFFTAKNHQQPDNNRVRDPIRGDTGGSTSVSHRENRHDPTASGWQGDEISVIKDENITRMMFHNVNGITTQGCEGIDMFVNNQLSLEVDLINHSWRYTPAKTLLSTNTNLEAPARCC